VVFSQLALRGQNAGRAGSLPVAINAGVNEANVVLVVEVGTHLLGGLQESGEGQTVGQVGVEVVLSGLEVVHVLDGEVVVADLGEREGLVVQLLGGDCELGVLATLTQLGEDVLGVVPVIHLEVAGELTELVVQVVLSDLKGRRAGLGIELHKRVKELLVGASASSGEQSND